MLTTECECGYGKIARYPVLNEQKQQIVPIDKPETVKADELKEKFSALKEMVDSEFISQDDFEKKKPNCYQRCNQRAVIVILHIPTR